MLAERPLDRAGLLRELAARGHPGLGQRSINVLMPWAAAQGLVAGLPDGRYRAAQPPAAVDPDLALATLAAGTWGLTGQGSRRTVTIRWFRRPAASAELRAEQVGVQSFLGLSRPPRADRSVPPHQLSAS